MDYGIRLLLISYYWPPLGGPGAIRPVKFAKYLPQFGIFPIVLTRKDIAYHSLDSELGSELEDLQVLRTESFDPARVLYLLGKAHFGPKRWQAPVRQLINFPDNKIGWIPFAYVGVRNINFDLIFVTGPPFSSFILGYYLARKRGKPLILDFRDAWLEFPFIPYLKTQRLIVSYWEAKITRFASSIVVVDENIKNRLIEKYPEISERITVIPNGYDPDDFKIEEKDKIFTIAYLGTVRRERSPETVLKAVAQFLAENRLTTAQIRFKFIGNIEEPYLGMIRQYSFVEVLGHLPYTKAIREFCRSHLGIMITTGSEFFFPSRQNEYLASGLPVIVCGRSKGIHLLESAFKKGYPGWIYDFNDIEGMKQRVSEVYQKFQQEKIIKGENPFKEYTRKTLTERLARLITSRA